MTVYLWTDTTTTSYNMEDIIAWTADLPSTPVSSMVINFVITNPSWEPLYFWDSQPYSSPLTVILHNNGIYVYWGQIQISIPAPSSSRWDKDMSGTILLNFDNDTYDADCKITQYWADTPFAATGSLQWITLSTASPGGYAGTKPLTWSIDITVGRAEHEIKNVYIGSNT